MFKRLKPRTRHVRYALVPALLAATAIPAAASADLMSAGALTFGPQNTLFVGDTFGNKVVAYDLSDSLSDQSDYVLGRAETFEGRTIIGDFRGELGELLAAPPEQIMINDMTVHESTGQIVFSGQRGLGPDGVPFIGLVDRGVLRLLDHTALDFEVHELERPTADASLEFGQLTQSYAITDIDWYDGEIFVAGVAGDSFDSTLRRVAYPFAEGTSSETQIEIWHAVHAQWETRAPIIAQTITELDGEPTLIAVYACTPLVRIPLADLHDGTLVRGEMIGELGYGNTPIDIVQYTNPMDGSNNVLVTHTHRSANAIPLTQVSNAEPMPVEVPNNFGPAGLTGFPVPATDVMHMAMVNEAWAVALRPSPNDPGVMQLHSLLVPFFFDRADHMVEMNWPGAADPFGYRQFPPLEL